MAFGGHPADNFLEHAFKIAADNRKETKGETDQVYAQNSSELLKGHICPQEMVQTRVEYLTV